MGGSDKGWALRRGEPLVQAVLAQLRSQVSGPVIVSANRSLAAYAALGCEVVPDGDPLRDEGGGTAGPLAGMLAVLAHLARAQPGRAVAFVPCDAPEFPADLVARLHAAAGQGAAVACSGGRWQPVFCLLPAGALPALRQAWEGGERRPESFLRSLGAVAVDFPAPGAFRNCNTPEDLA